MLLLDLKDKNSFLNSCNKSKIEDENNKLSQQQSTDQLIANSRAPTKSGLTITRIAKLDNQQK